MEKYDLVVIGSGPAGYAAAMRGIDYEKRVCIIEAQHIGGAGIMNGVLSSKTMWELSRDYAIAAKTNRGYRASGLVVDYSEVRKTVIKAVKEKQYQLLSQIQTYSDQNSDTGSVTLKRGWAKFVNKSTVEIDNKGEKELISGDNFVIATGSRPRPHPLIEVDQKRIIDSEGILNLKTFPERMMIIGSGIIGCEFATIFSNFKQTEVHLLDRSHRVLPFEDNDIGDFVSKNLEDNGVTIHHTANLSKIEKYDDHLEVFLNYQDGHCKIIEVDVVLLSIGRLPNYEKLGLKNIGVTQTERGFLNINQICMLEDNPDRCHIFAAGDISGHGQLYSIAEHQGRYSVEGIYDNKIYTADYSALPTLMFFNPLVAAVGMNEKNLQKEKIAYKVVVYSNALVARAIAMRSVNGFVKVIVSDDGEQRILGMRASGPQASAFIVTISHLINHGNSLEEVLNVVHPHPSITEAVQECLRVIDESSVYKPKAFPEFIQIRSWNPEVKED